MNLETLKSFHSITVAVTREGHGVKPGVYIIEDGNEQIPLSKAVALLNDKKAYIASHTRGKYAPITSREQIEKQSVSGDGSSNRRKAERIETRSDGSTGGKSGEKSEIIGEGLSRDNASERTRTKTRTRSSGNKTKNNSKKKNSDKIDLIEPNLDDHNLDINAE